MHSHHSNPLTFPFQSLFDQASDLVQAMSPMGHIRYVNEAWQERLGYDKAAVIGVDWLEFVHPSCRDRLASALTQHVRQESMSPDPLTQIQLISKSGQCCDVEGAFEWMPFQPFDGDTRDGNSEDAQIFCLWRVLAPFEMQCCAIYDGSGIYSRPLPHYYFSWEKALTADLRENSQNNDQLRLIKSVFTNAHDSIVITEAEPIEWPGPKIIYVNPAFTNTTGYTPEEVIGKTPRILQGPKSDRATLNRVRQALKNWESIDVELINYRKGGSEFWVEMTIVPITDVTGWCTHWMAIQRDVTERKTLEAELLKALERERELNDLKTRFISITSHEFRTPLTSIMSSVEILDYFSNTEAERKELFEQIYSSIHHLSQLLDDVLFIGRADSDRIQLNYEELDIPSFCLDILEEAKQGFGKHHQFQYQQKGTPQAGLIDPKLLRQIITNLLSNAVKYSDTGSLISVLLEFEADQFKFQVSDQGIGISKDDLGRLFDFFYRGNNVSNIAGTGLGLAIVKKCIDLLQGAIAVDSELQHGTRFTVTLPFKPFLAEF
jgi:PAS domain S-box-containing protein